MAETVNETFTDESDASDERSTDEIRHDIEKRRRSIAETVERAGQKLEDSLDWRTQAREHPFAAIAIAAGAGYVAAAMLRRRKTPDLSAAFTNGVERISGSLSDSIRATTRTRTGIAQAIGAAVTAVGARLLVQMFRDVAIVEDSKPKLSGGNDYERSIH